MGTRPSRDVVYTYRYLRGGMIALLLMLLLSVVLQWWWTEPRCWLGSISAYYFTPVRGIFVGSLCAVGAALVVYRGHSPEEDVLLNFSGFMAFVVAMVPTVPDTRCGPNGYAQSTEEIAAAVRNNIWSLLVIGLLAVAVSAWFRRAELANPQTRPGLRTVLIFGACTVVLGVELVLFLVLRDRFIAVSHGLAASTMVVGVIAVMVLSAFGVADRHSPGRTADAYRRVYLGIAIALGVSLALTVGLALLWPGFDHVVLVGEVVIIVLFGTYWGVQTKELWDLRESTDVESREVSAVAE